MRCSTLTASALIGTLALTAGPAGAQPGPVFDHLKCYKLKLRLKPIKYTLDLIPEQSQFLAETGCVLPAKPKWLCIDVLKTNVQPPPPNLVPGEQARDYLCYKLKCPKGVAVPIRMRDQFGEFDVIVKNKPDHLCVPADKVLPGTPTPLPTVTPTPTPTATPVEPPCRLDAVGQCGGFCPTPLKCLFVGGTTGCDCVPPDQMCMAQDAAGTCAGLCPHAADVCEQVAGTTDCDCFPSSQPCHDAGGGVCGGQCPPGEACVFDAALGCGCSGNFCGPQAPDGQCGGLCPNPTHDCISSGPLDCACSPLTKGE